jgi:hypothetical protein
MVGVLTSPPASLVKGWVCHCSGVKHRVKLLDLQVYIFTVFGQQRHKLVDYDSGDQRVVCRRAVDLLALSLDLAKFLMKRLGPISEPLSARWETSIEHGVVPPRGSTILSLLIRLPQAIMLVSW